MTGIQKNIRVAFIIGVTWVLTLIVTVIVVMPNTAQSTTINGSYLTTNDLMRIQRALTLINVDYNYIRRALVYAHCHMIFTTDIDGHKHARNVKQAHWDTDKDSIRECIDQSYWRMRPNSDIRVTH